MVRLTPGMECGTLPACFQEVICACTDGLSVDVLLGDACWRSERGGCSRNGCGALQGRARQREVCFWRGPASGALAVREYSRGEFAGLLWQRHSEARRYDRYGAGRRSEEHTSE